MPTILFTDSGLRRLAPLEDKAQTEYRDSKTPGLSLVVGKSTKTWFATYRTPSGRKRIKLGRFPSTTLADARDRAEAVQHEAYSDVDPAAKRKARRAAPTFRELAESCIADKVAHGRLTRKTRQSYDSLLNGEILPRIGSRKIDDLSRADVAGVINPIRARGKPYLANRALELMRAICRWASSTDKRPWIRRPGSSRRRSMPATARFQIPSSRRSGRRSTGSAIRRATATSCCCSPASARWKWSACSGVRST